MLAAILCVMRLLLKTKLYITAIFIVVIGLMALAYATYVKPNNSSDVYIVKDILSGVCTTDIPTSTCGPSQVEVVSETGESKTYLLPGFNGREEREKIGEMSRQLNTSKEQNARVKITVKGNTITAVTQIK